MRLATSNDDDDDDDDDEEADEADEAEEWCEDAFDNDGVCEW